MERNQGHIDEGTLHAWLDGALPPDESARVESHVASCAACGAAAAEARGLVAAASRILTALDDIPGGVAPGGTGAGGASSASRFRASTARRRWTGWPLRAAAAVLFVATGSFAVIRQLGESRLHSAEAPAVPPAVPQEVPRAAEAPSTPPMPTPPPARKKLQQPAAPNRDVEVATSAAPAEQNVEQTVEQKVAQQADAVAKDSAARAPGPVLITGRVVSEKTGAPVAEAQVHLSEPSISAATNANGDYAIPVPASMASNQPAKLTVRRIGFESRVDSVTLAQSAPSDTVRHDVALKENTMALSEVVVSGAGKRARSAGVAGGVAPGAASSPAAAPTGLQELSARREMRRIPSAPGCYAINAPGLPSRIEIGEHLRVMPPDSAAFPTAYWVPVGTIKVRIVLGDTSGAMHDINAMIVVQGLLGQVKRSDSTSVVTPFSAIWTAPRCP